MPTTIRKRLLHPIHRDIQAHPAWYGRISGLVADKMLRNRETPFLYLLREGEHQTEDEMDYYISFVLKDLTIRHHPFRITITAKRWCYDDTDLRGPFAEESITDVLHLMMGCQKEDCIPLSKPNTQ
jgi:hypothetical protein